MTKQGPRPFELRLFLALAALASLPYWVVAIPPGTDLPQHLSQIILAKQVWAGERTDMVFAPWYFPQNLIYGLVGMATALATPMVAGKLVMTTLVALWLYATYYLTRSQQRPTENWIVSAVLIFNFLFNWGLLNFLIAWPIFCIFLSRSTRLLQMKELRPLDFLSHALFFLLLYYAHALVFLLSNAVLAALCLLSRRRSHYRLLLTAAPAWGLALTWYPTLAELRAASGANVAPGWQQTPLERLDLDALTDSLFGYILNPIENAMTIVLIGWVALAVFQHRHALRGLTNIPLLATSLFMLSGWLLLPEYYMNTIFFGERWLPLGATLLILALPSPSLPRRLATFVPITMFASMTAVAAVTLIQHEKEEQDGLLEALNSVKPTDSLIAVDRLGSSYLKGSPDLQVFAYSQAMHGNDIHFSFAEHYSGIVIPRSRIERIVNQKEIWNELTAAGGTAREFNVLLVGADDTNHRMIAQTLKLGPGTPPNTTWRLYQLNPTKRD